MLSCILFSKDCNLSFSIPPGFVLVLFKFFSKCLYKHLKPILNCSVFMIIFCSYFHNFSIRVFTIILNSQTLLNMNFTVGFSLPETNLLYLALQYINGNNKSFSKHCLWSVTVNLNFVIFFFFFLLQRVMTSLAYL